MRMFTFSAPKDSPWNSKIENINIGMFHVFCFMAFWLLVCEFQKHREVAQPKQRVTRTESQWSSYLLVRLL